MNNVKDIDFLKGVQEEFSKLPELKLSKDCFNAKHALIKQFVDAYTETLDVHFDKLTEFVNKAIKHESLDESFEDLKKIIQETIKQTDFGPDIGVYAQIWDDIIPYLTKATIEVMLKRMKENDHD